MTQYQGQVRGPKVSDRGDGIKLTFSLLLPDGREVFVQSAPDLQLQAGDRATVFGTFDNEGTLVASMIQTFAAPEPPSVVTPTPALKIRWGRLIGWALLGNLIAGVFAIVFLQPNVHSTGTRALLFALFSFFLADWLAKVFHGKQGTEKSWIAGLMALLLPIGASFLN